MQAKRDLIRAARQIALTEDEVPRGDRGAELISYHPEGKGHDPKGSIGTDRIPKNVLKQLPEKYHNHGSVGPEVTGGEGTVVVSYKAKRGSADGMPLEVHHVTLAEPKKHKSYVAFRSADHDRYANYGRFNKI